KQLGDDDFYKREEASKRLTEIGEPALGTVQKATTSEDLEVRHRAAAIVAVIDTKLYGVDLSLPGPASSVSISADGKRLLTIDNRTVRLWDADTGKELRVFEGHTDVVRGAALSPDGTRVLSGSGHGQSG